MSYDANGTETAGVGSTTRSSGTYNTKDQYTSVTVSGTARAMDYAGRDNTERVSASGITFQNAMLGLASRTSGGGSTYYTRDPDGTLISVRSATGSSYYVFDGLGSVAALVSSAGLAVNTYTYDPYGVIRSSSETVTNNFKFTGAYYDSDKQLYKLGLRYYDPTLGRFTRRTPRARKPTCTPTLAATRSTSPTRAAPVAAPMPCGARRSALSVPPSASSDSFLRVRSRLGSERSSRGQA